MKKLLLLLALTTALPVGLLAQQADLELLKTKKSPFFGACQHGITRAGDNRQGVTATLQYVQLPDMKTPRDEHQTFVVGHCLVVVGGHNNGLKRIGTAEVIDVSFTSSGWKQYEMKNVHDGAFAVRQRLNLSTSPSTGYLIGGGFEEDGYRGRIAATSKPIYIFSDNIMGFNNGPKLSTPRAQASGIYVNGKTYVSGNLNGDDSTMEVLEEGSNKFTPVGKTTGRCKPYMFADNLGRVMSMSPSKNDGDNMEFYTDEDGQQMLLGDLYDPSTGQTRLIGWADFKPGNVPLFLPADAKSEDYAVINDEDGCHYYFILTRNGDGCLLYTFCMENMGIDKADDFDIPKTDKGTGEEIHWRGSVIANQKRKELYMVGTSGINTSNVTLHIISMNYETGDWTIASAGGFKHNLRTASWTLLNDGRLACTGGGNYDSIGSQATAYIFNPPVAGTTKVAEPDDNGEGGESSEGGLCVVVENTNGEKVRYLLEEEPRFYMKGETVTVVTPKVTIDYQADDIARVYIEDYTSTDIDISELPTLKEGSMSIEAGRIVITGLESGETATVYQLSGTPVTTAKADQAGRIVISIDGTPGKVSIIKTKHQSFKIIRK